MNKRFSRVAVSFGWLLITAGFISGCNSSAKLENKDASSKPVKYPNSRNDAWGVTGYGGGGATFFPAVSPFNPDYAMVACDMTGSFVTENGGESWRMFNLRGPVKFFVFDPSDSNTVYANSIALFKSSDHGNTWSVFYPSPNLVKGVVSKGDHASEVIITADSTQRHVSAFAIDPADSRKLYAAISIDKATAYYTSEDGGKKWTKEKELQEPAKNIYINPASPKDNRTVYIATAGAVLCRENGNWKTNKAPAGVTTLTEFSGGYDSQLGKYIIYAMSGKSYFDAKGSTSGIFYTENGGETWENRQDGIVNYGIKGAAAPEWRTIATSSQHPGTVYVSYNNLHVHADTTCIGVAKSVDYGKTWQLTWKDKLVKSGNIVSENFKSGWINDRFGPTWGENPFSIGVSPVNPDICYATDFGRTVKTINGGKTWEENYTKKKEGAGWSSRGLDVTTGYSVVFDPFDTSHVFITNTDIGLMESKDGGQSWLSATKDNGVPRKWVNSTYWFTFDPEVRGRAWVAMSDVHDLPRPKMWRKKPVAGFGGGILETEDGGKTWKTVSAGIGEGAMTHVLIDPASNKDARVLYASAYGKGVYKSVDGGKTWLQKNKGIEGKEPFAWRIIRDEKKGTLFLIVCRRSDDGSIGNEEDGAVYRSVDGAENWTRITLPEGTNGPMSIATDPGNPAQLLLSAWGRPAKGNFSADIGGGIFISKDNGSTWKAVLQKDQHMHDITYDARNKTYYACGFNGSAYRSEDRGESWQRIKGFNFKWGKRVDLDPRNPDKIFVMTFGGGLWYGPAKGDPAAVEDIITPALDR